MAAANDQVTRRFNLFSLLSAGGIALIAFAILLRQRHSLVTAVVVALAWAGAVQGLGWGLAEVIAPGRVIRWRHRLIPGQQDWRYPVGQYFSKKFDVLGPEPWKNPIARRRIRLLGLFLTITGIGLAAVLVWIPGVLDNLVAGFSVGNPP